MRGTTASFGIFNSVAMARIVWTFDRSVNFDVTGLSPWTAYKSDHRSPLRSSMERISRAKYGLVAVPGSTTSSAAIMAYRVAPSCCCSWTSVSAAQCPYGRSAAA